VQLTPQLLVAAGARFADALRDPERAQRELLLSILGRNAGCEYGRRHDFASIRTIDEYRARVPIVDYQAIRALHERACAGEPDVLFAGRAVFVGATSGTKDGRPKLFAFSREVAVDYHHYLSPMLLAIERDHPGTNAYTLRLTGSAGVPNAAGITTGSTSGLAATVLSGLESHCPLPQEVLCADFEARYYTTLRLALQYRVRCLSTVTPGVLLSLFRRGHHYAEPLAHDLDAGTCDAGPPLAPALREALRPLLRADHAAAARVRCQRRRFDPIEVWPELRLIQAWKAGALRYDIEALAQICPGIPIWPMNSGTTEAALLVALADAWRGGVPALLSTWFELFPVDEDPLHAPRSPLPELSEGHAYRAIVTSERGCYRYLLDDVFYVEAMHHGVPVLRYSHRLGMVSSVAGEKLNEVHVMEAATRAAAAIGLPLGEYQLVPERGQPYRYILCAELPQELCDEDLRRFLQSFEDALHENFDYALYRGLGTLDPPELAVVAAGEFERRRSVHADQTGQSDAQLKTPRLRGDPIANRDELAALHWVKLKP